MKSVRLAAAVVAIAAICLVCTQACVVRGRGGGGFPFLIGFLTAVAIHDAIYLEHHDTHVHDEFCGHYRVWVEDRWLYWYHGHWEYYDYETGRWYMVPASPPEGHEDQEGAED